MRTYVPRPDDDDVIQRKGEDKITKGGIRRRRHTAIVQKPTCSEEFLRSLGAAFLVWARAWGEVIRPANLDWLVGQSNISAITEMLFSNSCGYVRSPWYLAVELLIEEGLIELGEDEKGQFYDLAPSMKEVQ